MRLEKFKFDKNKLSDKCFEKLIKFLNSIHCERLN